METINEKNFLPELIAAIPEFGIMHQENQEYHNIGIHLIMGDLMHFTENAIHEGNEPLLSNITTFIVCCYEKSQDEVHNALFVSFFENLSDKGLDFFYRHLPPMITEDVKKFLEAFDKATEEAA